MKKERKRRRREDRSFYLLHAKTVYLVTIDTS